MRGVETGENKDVKNSKIQFNDIKMKAPGYSFSKKKKKIFTGFFTPSHVSLMLG